MFFHKIIDVLRKIIVDSNVNLYYIYVNKNTKNDMANILKTEKKVAVISMLCEGSSIRAIERITGIQKKTIWRLALRVGEACAKIMDEKMRGLKCQQIEVDEIWGFIGASKRTPAAQVIMAMSGHSLRWTRIRN